jgi:chromosome segregation ATPase
MLQFRKTGTLTAPLPQEHIDQIWEFFCEQHLLGKKTKSEKMNALKEKIEELPPQFAKLNKRYYSVWSCDCSHKQSKVSLDRKLEEIQKAIEEGEEDQEKMDNLESLKKELEILRDKVINHKRYHEN